MEFHPEHPQQTTVSACDVAGEQKDLNRPVSTLLMEWGTRSSSEVGGSRC